MNVGDKVISKINIGGQHMFPKKYELPEEANFKIGSAAKVEIIYKTGWGIVEFQNRKRVLVSDLESKFEVSV